MVLYSPYLARALSVTSLFLFDEPSGSALFPVRVECLALQSETRKKVFLKYLIMLKRKLGLSF